MTDPISDVGGDRITEYKLNIKNFNSFLARKLIDEEEEEKAVKKILEEEL